MKKSINSTIDKTIISLLIASSFLISSQAIHAQNDHPEPPARMEKMLDRMSEELGLTEEQTKAIRELKQKEFEQVRALRQKNREKIASLLTDKQKDLMKARKMKRNCKS